MQPSGPPRLVYFIGVTILGVGAGLGMSLLMSQISPVITSTQQLSRVTGIPVFGTVSANETLGLHQWHRRKTVLFMMSNLVLLVLLVGFISYFAFPDIVQAPLKGVLG